MSFHIPIGTTSLLPTQSQRIQAKHAQARASLAVIDKISEDIPFGAKISHVLNNYHFSTVEAADTFFQQYLLNRTSSPIDREIINTYLSNTINCFAPDVIDNKYATDRAFEVAFTRLSERFEFHKNAPTVAFLVGPTGAGKTAFSKSLFTVNLSRFWGRRTIPTRVEYSRYVNRYPDSLDAECHFSEYTRLCQFRDLIIYFYCSGRIDRKERELILSKAPLGTGALLCLKHLEDKTAGMCIDGENCCLDSDNRDIFFKACAPIEDQEKIDFLYYLAKSIGLKFAISYDGFDSAHIEDFLFNGKTPTPITPLVMLLKGLQEKRRVLHPLTQPTDNHYLLYLRDTTFERLRPEILRGIGGAVHYPIYWIIPPKYENLVKNTERSICRVGEVGLVGTSRAQEFTDEIFSAFDRTVFDGTDMVAASHMSFVFGSNARDMKRHIRQTLVSALYRASQIAAIDFDRDGGIDAKTVWMKLVDHHSVGRLPRYSIFEDLFLDSTRQLFPKLRVDFVEATRLLNDGDIDSVVSHAVDRGETSGVFGCLLNYFYAATIGNGRAIQSAILLPVRMLQFIDRNPRYISNEVFDFVRMIGYNFCVSALQFTLYVLIRSELIKWDASTDGRLIGNVPLYLSTKGFIALHKLLLSTTYLSESALVAIHHDRRLTCLFSGRRSENPIWIADCVKNASIMLYIIGKCEEIEWQSARLNDINLSEYTLYDKLHSRLSLEARSILRGDRKTRDRWSANSASIVVARSAYPEMVVLGEKK